MLQERIPDRAKCVEPDRVRPRGVHRPRDLRVRDAALIPRAVVGSTAGTKPGAEARRLLHRADRPPADADGARRGRRISVLYTADTAAS